MARENSNTTLRRENEDLKSNLSKVDKILTNTMKEWRKFKIHIERYSTKMVVKEKFN